MKIETVEQADKVTPDWIRLNVDHDAAVAVYQDKQYRPVPNSLVPAVFTMPALGTWRCDDMGEYSVLVAIAPGDMVAGEGEWEIAMRYESTQQYIEWQQAGLLPPPLEVIRNANGRLSSLNRRRWLAARAAGTRLLYCWYSPTHPQHCSRSAYWLPERSSYYVSQYKYVVESGGRLLDYLGQYVIDSIERAGVAV